MSNLISHIVGTNGGAYFALPFKAGASITYDDAAPLALVGKGVTVTGDRTVDLVLTGARVDGCIRKVEPTDGDSVKLTVQLKGSCPFMNEEATAAVAVGGGIIGGAVAGEIASGGVDTDARGLVTSLEDGYTVVIL